MLETAYFWADYEPTLHDLVGCMWRNEHNMAIFEEEYKKYSTSGQAQAEKMFGGGYKHGINT